MAVIHVRSQATMLAQSISAGENQEFSLIADEPTKLGGANSGATPYDLLLGALGSCMSMTMLMYAKRKGWPLEHVEIRLEHNRVHAKDCEQCETPTGMIDRVSIRTELTGALEADQKKRIIAIGERCPVRNTLTKGIVFDST